MKRKEFAISTRKGQTVYQVEIGIRSSSDMKCPSTINRHGIHIEQLKIVHQTERKIALSDPWITCLDRQVKGQRKASFYHFLETCDIRIVTKESYFANGIFATMYTVGDPKKAINIIQSKMKYKVNNEFSFLQGINVDEIIKGFTIEMEK